MNEITQFLIEFTDNAVFYGGNCVYGELYIQAAGVILPTEITIECIGVVKLRKRTCFDKAFSCALPVYRKESVFKKSIDSTAHVSRDSKISRIPFSFSLPRGVPQSLECGVLGHVRYWCQARISLRGKERNRLFTWRPFTVLEELDLNTLHPENHHGLSTKLGHDVFDVCCFKSCGRLEGELVLAKKHYVPGENISARFSLENNSRVRIRSIHLLLTQTMCRPGESNEVVSLLPTKPAIGCLLKFSPGISMVVTKTDFSGLEPGETLHMPRARLHIPALPCTSKAASWTSDASGVAKKNNPRLPTVGVSYAVVLMALVRSTMASEYLLAFPVLIGSLPHLTDESISGISSSSLNLSYVESASSVTNLHAPSSLRSWSGRAPSNPVTHFSPAYAYYPTIGMSGGAGSTSAIDGTDPTRLVKRRSILKKRGEGRGRGGHQMRTGSAGDMSSSNRDSRLSGDMTDISSIAYSWNSNQSLNTKFETPV